LEERYVDIDLPKMKPIQFDEGTLTFLTAIYLKALLEKEGAEVMVTRAAIGQGVYRQSFFSWLADQPYLWGEKKHLSQLFRAHYNGLDLRERAEKINQFHPDLTVIIHYNAHDSEEENSLKTKVTDRNFNLVFMPGGFCQGELASVENRYEFVRLLVSDDLERSEQLSKCLLAQFIKVLDVPSISAKDGASYLERACLKVDEGVYARNLALTRLVHGPVAYGETLVQNNALECLKLAQKDTEIDGIPCSSRIKQVAQAYASGIKDYVLKSEN
jgi:N-acetylmuramoyl-L-alanine amidase